LDGLFEYLFAVTDKTWTDDAHVQLPAANVDPGGAAGGGWHTGQGDGAAKGRGKAAAGDLPFSDTSHYHCLVSPQHGPLVQHQAYLLRLVTSLALGFQGLAADEVAIGRLPGDGPTHVGGQRRGLLVDVGAIQVQAGFQA